MSYVEVGSFFSYTGMVCTLLDSSGISLIPFFSHSFLKFNNTYCPPTNLIIQWQRIDSPYSPLYAEDSVRHP